APLRGCFLRGACLLRRGLFDRGLLSWLLRDSGSFSCRFGTALRGYWFHGFRTFGCLLHGHDRLLGLQKRDTFRGCTSVSWFATTHGTSGCRRWAPLPERGVGTGTAPLSKAARYFAP